MTAGTATRQISPLVVVPAALLGVLGALLLARSDAPVDTAVRAVADLAAATVLGLGLLLLLFGQARHVDEQQVWRHASIVALWWAVCELALTALGAARSSASTVADLTVSTYADYLGNIASGRVGAAVVVVALAVAVFAAVLVRAHLDASAIVLVVPVVVASIARPMIGHMAQQPAGALLVALHVVAASVWLGLLLAMALTLRSKTSWAQVLPRFSAIALWCVVVIVVTGVVNSAIRLGSLAAITDTGYGRLVLAKTALVLVLVGTGWWQRRTWVARIGSHTVDPAVSIRRAVLETAVIAVVFGVAAALSTTA